MQGVRCMESTRNLKKYVGLRWLAYIDTCQSYVRLKHFGIYVTWYSCMTDHDRTSNNTEYEVLLLLRRVRSATYCAQRVCVSASLSVCLSALMSQKTTSKFLRIFCSYPWPWLGPSATTMTVQCVMYFRVVDDVMPSCNGPNGPESKTMRIFRPIRQVAAPGRSLPSPTASC